MLLVLSGFGSCTYNYASVAAAKHRFVAGADGGGGCGSTYNKRIDTRDIWLLISLVPKTF